jgi:hypothetical protein
LKVSKMLTEWWDGGQFSRVPASGGLHWKDDQRVAGDIVPPPDGRFPFVIECKKQEGFELAHLFKNMGKPREWWHQCVLDARRVNRVPILLFSKNRDSVFVLLPYKQEMFDRLVTVYPVSRQSVSVLNIREEEEWFDTILTTYDALKEIEPDTLREWYEDIAWDSK